MRENGPNGHFLAGGTDLTIAIKEKGWTPHFVVDLKRIPGLAGIQVNAAGEFCIGALTTLNEVETSETVIDHCAFLAQAASEIGSIQIRNRGTIGGNIVNGSPSADVIPSLMVLDAALVISDGTSERQVAIEDFFEGPGRTAINVGEILTQIVIPKIDPQLRGDYIKHSPREAMDLASVGVAVTVILDTDNKCQHVRIALGAVSPTPVRAPKAEAMLLGQVLTAELAGEVGKQATQECTPIGDVRSSAPYRLEMVRANCKRALLNAAARTGGAVAWFQRGRKRY